MWFSPFLSLVFFLLINIISGLDYKKYEEAITIVKRINKPALLTIKSLDGDTIDCVDKRKQPAFDHPLLYEHKIQRLPKQMRKVLSKSSSMNKASQIWLKNGTRCPKDTVPIRRATIADVTRESSFYDKPMRYAKYEYASVSHHDSQSTIHGAQAHISLWQPLVHGPHDFSTAQLWIKFGNITHFYYITVGWHVYPLLYGDSKTRLFIQWNNENQFGYNLLSGGFVITGNELVLGGSFSPTSTYGDINSQHEMVPVILKDKKEGHWWLSVGGQEVGYWPNTLFNRFGGEANRVEWGGQVLKMTTNTHYMTTQMGSGHFPVEGRGKASSFTSLMVSRGDNQFYLLQQGSLQELVTNKHCYDLAMNNPHSFYFGGPGNSSLCTNVQ